MGSLGTLPRLSYAHLFSFQVSYTRQDLANNNKTTSAFSAILGTKNEWKRGILEIHFGSRAFFIQDKDTIVLSNSFEAFQEHQTEEVTKKDLHCNVNFGFEIWRMMLQNAAEKRTITHLLKCIAKNIPAEEAIQSGEQKGLIGLSKQIIKCGLMLRKARTAYKKDERFVILVPGKLLIFMAPDIDRRHVRYVTSLLGAQVNMMMGHLEIEIHVPNTKSLSLLPPTPEELSNWIDALEYSAKLATEASLKGSRRDTVNRYGGKQRQSKDKLQHQHVSPFRKEFNIIDPGRADVGNGLYQEQSLEQEQHGRITNHENKVDQRFKEYSNRDTKRDVSEVIMHAGYDYTAIGEAGDYLEGGDGRINYRDYEDLDKTVSSGSNQYKGSLVKDRHDQAWSSHYQKQEDRFYKPANHFSMMQTETNILPTKEKKQEYIVSPGNKQHTIERSSSGQEIDEIETRDNKQGDPFIDKDPEMKLEHRDHISKVRHSHGQEGKSALSEGLHRILPSASPRSRTVRQAYKDYPSFGHKLHRDDVDYNAVGRNSVVQDGRNLVYQGGCHGGGGSIEHGSNKIDPINNENIYAGMESESYQARDTSADVIQDINPSRYQGNQHSDFVQYQKQVDNLDVISTSFSEGHESIDQNLGSNKRSHIDDRDTHRKSHGNLSLDSISASSAMLSKKAALMKSENNEDFLTERQSVPRETEPLLSETNYFKDPNGKVRADSSAQTDFLPRFKQKSLNIVIPNESTQTVPATNIPEDIGSEFLNSRGRSISMARDTSNRDQCLKAPNTQFEIMSSSGSQDQKHSYSRSVIAMPGKDYQRSQTSHERHDMEDMTLKLEPSQLSQHLRTYESFKMEQIPHPSYQTKMIRPGRMGSGPSSSKKSHGLTRSQGPNIQAELNMSRVQDSTGLNIRRISYSQPVTGMKSQGLAGPRITEDRIDIKDIEGSEGHGNQRIKFPSNQIRVQRVEPGPLPSQTSVPMVRDHVPDVDSKLNMAGF